MLQYALPGRLEDLDDEGRDTLEEAYKADPSWASKVWQLTPMYPGFIRHLRRPFRDFQMSETLRMQKCMQADFTPKAVRDIRAGRLVIELLTDEVSNVHMV